jgi:hypothetical protein
LNNLPEYRLIDYDQSIDLMNDWCSARKSILSNFRVYERFSLDKRPILDLSTYFEVGEYQEVYPEAPYD